MKKIITILLVTVSLCHRVTTHAYAIYDPTSVPNNKFGIHILDVSELEPAAKLVNSSGGDWGYVTVPIQAGDRTPAKWQTFMTKCSELHIIPILRITTIPRGGTWEAGADTDLVDFANFLNELDWPTENRYIVIFNEVNRSTEWGDKVNPQKYARILKNAREIFKKRSEDFYILPAGLDLALSDTTTSMSATNYFAAMKREDPAIWSYIDGWNSHSYPNPAFSALPSKTGLQSILGYKAEQKLIKINQKPVFITETGWSNEKIGEGKRATNFDSALKIWDKDNNIVAITPFLFQAGTGPYAPFSYLTPEGLPTDTYNIYQDYPKKSGNPPLSIPHPSPLSVGANDYSPESHNSNIQPIFKFSRALGKLENIIRQLLRMPLKQILQIKTTQIFVETVTTPENWERGLSFRESLGEYSGMYFVFPQPHIPIFWMKDMNFPVDILWIKDDQIVDISANTPVPTTTTLPTYSPKVPVNRVLEVPAGFFAKHELSIGDKLTIL